MKKTELARRASIVQRKAKAARKAADTIREACETHWDDAPCLSPLKPQSWTWRNGFLYPYGKRNSDD